MPWTQFRHPVSLYDPVYTEGGDTLYVMDQISDRKEPGGKLGRSAFLLNEAVKRLDGPGAAHHPSFVFTRERPRWRWRCLIRISQAQVSRLEKNAL